MGKGGVTTDIHHCTVGVIIGCGYDVGGRDVIPIQASSHGEGWGDNCC